MATYDQALEHAEHEAILTCEQFEEDEDINWEDDKEHKEVVNKIFDVIALTMHRAGFQVADNARKQFVNSWMKHIDEGGDACPAMVSDSIDDSLRSTNAIRNQ